MDRFAHGVVAAEREAHVTHTAADAGVRQRGLDLARGVDEIHRVVGVLFDAGPNREDVGVKNDVFGRKAELFSQQTIGTRADADLALFRVGLPLLVERHHDHGCAIAAHECGLTNELRLAFLE